MAQSPGQGMGTGPDSWRAQVAGLPDGFVGHAPRIAGLSDGDGEFSVGRAVDEVVAGLDRLGVDRAHVCELSLGAMLATQLAITHPARVASHVISGGQVHPPRVLMALQAGLTRILPRRVIAPDGTSRQRILRSAASPGRWHTRSPADGGRRCGARDQH
ncbi:MAG: hypothetical protein QJR09_06255 [Micrococcus sp.]|nr:hypothetical protein [Micrococcus sp.]